MTAFRALAACALFTAIAAPAGAVPILSGTFFYTQNVGPSGLASQPQGQFVQIAAIVNPASTSDPISSLAVVGTQGAVTQPLNFFPYAQTLFPGLYVVNRPFAGAVTSSGWSVTASDGTGPSAPSLSAAITNPVMLPFVNGISVSDASPTPTVSWALPDLTGYSVDNVYVRIIDAGTENQLYQAELGGLLTSFVVPGGLLLSGHSYVYRVGLVDFGPFGIENQSLAYSSATRVPEPAAALLLAAVAAGLVRKWSAAGKGWPPKQR